MSAAERSNWRGEEYSRWHRSLGNQLPMTDVDSVEFHMLQPVGIVETKDWRASTEHIYNASLKAQENLAAAASLPMLLVIYDLDHEPYTFHVEPRNAEAEAYVPEPTLMMEDQYVSLLRALRKEPDATH